MHRFLSYLFLTSATTVLCSELLSSNGILVEDGGNVRQLSGIYTLLISLDSPEPPEVQEWINEIRSVAEQIAGCRSCKEAITLDDRKVWFARLDALERKMAREEGEMGFTVDLGRTRRGILDGVYNMFGLATSSEVSELETAIKDSRVNSELIFHNQGNLLSVLNKTKLLVEEQGHNLMGVRQGVARVKRNMLELRNASIELDTSLNQVIVTQNMELAITQVRDLVNEFQVRRRRFDSEVTDLELGRVTERIIPRKLLQELLDLIHRNNMGTLNMEWYYKYLKSVIVWDQRGHSHINLVYSVRLPGVSRETFLHYKFNNYFVPSGTKYLRRIECRPELVVNSRTGNSFIPNECSGEDPKVCEPLVTFKQPSCESGMIIGKLHKDCSVKIIERGNETSSLFRPRQGVSQIVIVPYIKQTIIKRCVGFTAEHMELAGPKLFNLTANCSFSSDAWQVVGIKETKITVHMNYPKYVTLPRINLSYPANIELQWEHDIEMRGLSEFRIGDLPTLVKPKFRKDARNKDSYWQWYLMAGVGCAVAILGIVLVLYIKFKGIKNLLGIKIRKNRNQNSEQVAQVGDIEMDSIQSDSPYAVARKLLQDVGTEVIEATI